MHLPSVKLFLEVAEAGSISKVATRRHTVQSHISRQISEFEAALGGALFRRTGRGVTLTPLGMRAAARLRGWLQETEQLQETLRAEAGQLWGEVRLGIVPSAAHPLMTHLFDWLQREHPGIRLNITEAQGTELDALLDGGAVDIAILFRFARPAGSDERLLSTAHSYLVSRPGDRLTLAPTLEFARLEGLQLVLPRRPSHWRDALDDAAHSHGFRLTAAAEADSLTVQKELVAHAPGLYSVIGPYSIDAELRQGRLQASRLINPDLVRHVVLALPKHGKLTQACRVVSDAIESLTQSWGQQLSPGLLSTAQQLGA
ncbi:LysR family transcriptional regulator [Delftia sp. PS-11]|uniref:LysR family transcriptional regulator n=1 Tax=Delftia sp. PS-11 TaxID=2767222 RepID=UPI00245679AC|nr:LysR family transcriptional regulator [Delftia sp. PS-11]KAJ8740720.1 LysR family transcriptional regulator [Delftia sp. PS-11]